MTPQEEGKVIKKKILELAEKAQQYQLAQHNYPTHIPILEVARRNKSRGNHLTLNKIK